MSLTFESLMEDSEERGLPLWRVILENEIDNFGGSEESVRSAMKSRLKIMSESVKKAATQALPTVGNLISGSAKRAGEYREKGNTLSGELINKVMTAALSCSEVNAAMGRICACPTAGSCGIVPAVIITLGEERDIPEDKLVEALILLSGLGAVVVENATVAGAEGGCQAECGVAAAMAAAGAVYLAGGDDNTCLSAFTIALVNVMGLVCDPIAGLVQIPCAQRNASQAVNALISADLALGGMTIPVTPDEAVAAMYAVGKSLPRELRETALGGIAATESARHIEKSIFG